MKSCIELAKELNSRATIKEVNYHNDSLGKIL